MYHHRKKYPFNGQCTFFLSNYCSILNYFPVAMMSRRNMPTYTGNRGNTLNSVFFPELLASPNIWGVLHSHLRISDFSGLMFIVAASVMADSEDGWAEMLKFQSM